MADINLNFNEKDLVRAAKELQKAAKSIETAFKKAGGPIKKDADNLKKAAIGAKRLATEKKKLTAIEKEELRQKRALETVTAKLALANSKNNRELLQKQKQLRKVNAELRSGTKNTATWGKALGSFQFKFNALGNIAANVVAKISQAIQKAVKDSLTLAAQMEGVETAFIRLGRPGLLRNLQEATRGTVDNLTLMQKAVQAKNFKIPLEKLAGFFKFATDRAIQTGESVDYLVDSIITGIGRKSVLVMDNLGISAVELQQEVKKVGDFGLAAANIIERAMEEAGETADTTAIQIGRVKTAYKNLLIVAGERAQSGFLSRGAAVAMEKLVKIMGNREVSEATIQFMEFFEAISDQSVEQQMAALTSEIESQRKIIKAVADHYQDLEDRVESTRGKEKRANKELLEKTYERQTANVALLRVYEAQLEALTKQGDEVDDVLPKIAKIKEIIDFGDVDLSFMDMFDVEGDDTMTKNLIKRNEAINEHAANIDALRAQTDDYIQNSIDKQNKEADNTALVEDLKQRKIQATFDLVSRLTDSAADIFEEAKQRELSAAGDNAKKREAIERKYRNRQKVFAIAGSIVDGAQAIQKIQASIPPPANIPFLIASAALTASQVGLIASQKFAKGGVDIDGPSHARGGILAEIEGGESVINKRSTSKYKGLLDAINQDDQARIQDALNRDRKISISGSGDMYTKKMYELMQKQSVYGEDNEYYYKEVGNTIIKSRKK